MFALKGKHNGGSVGQDFFFFLIYIFLFKDDGGQLYYVPQI